MTGEIVDCGLWIVDCKAPSVRRPGREAFYSRSLWSLSLSKGRMAGVEHEGRGDIGVRFDRLNELRGEAGKVLELVERPGVGAACERGSPLGVRFDPSTGSTNLSSGSSCWGLPVANSPCLPMRLPLTLKKGFYYMRRFYRGARGVRPGSIPT